ncbi:MAG: phosphate acyltransferase PlsX [Amylibacter sp.]|nr:phosphate acyltransferase PlsX [Amylibacter sp.]
MSEDINQVSPHSTKPVVLSIDAMGGDLGVPVVIAGMHIFSKENQDVKFIIHGDEAQIKPLLAKRSALSKLCEIHHAEAVVSMDDKPSQVMRHGKNTSMWSCIDAVRNKQAEVAVSCGNTGALMAVSMIRLRKVPGINRPAIAILWPSENPQGSNVMLDVGADIRAEASDLLQYALMGASYARNGLDVKRPRIGLLNVGTEEHKGRIELKEAHERISEQAERANFEFVGFVEGTDIPSDRVDVIVTDGFTGNVALKTAEGTALVVRKLLSQTFKQTPFAMLGGLLAYGALRRLSKRIDPRHSNGGVFLGLNGTVVKSHGGADANGIAAAIRLAHQLAKNGFTDKLAARVASGSMINNDVTSKD